jgi:hypothetical protein
MRPVEVVTDAAPVYPRVLDELLPGAWHHVEQYANDPIEAVCAGSVAYIGRCTVAWWRHGGQGRRSA